MTGDKAFNWGPQPGDGGSPPVLPGLDHRRLPRWLLDHPLVTDLIVAATVAAAAVLADIIGSGYKVRVPVVWDLLLAAPLVFRRRRPGYALGLIAVVCLAQWLADVRAAGDIAFLLALFSLGAYGRQRWALAAGIAVGELGVILALVRWGPASNWLLPALTATGTVSACWLVGIYVRMRRAYVQSMRDRAETAERDRDSRAQVAVAAERARIAREMHDVIAHSLSVMITLNDAAAAVEVSPQARQTIAQASEVGRHALGEMHRMLGVLRDDESTGHSPQPGVAELPDLVSLVRSAGFAVELAVTGDVNAIPPTAQLALYRIVQESLTNVVKHARQAEHVTVVIRRHDGCLDLRIDDDGAPATEGPGLGTPTGHGLSGMQERARLFDGRVTAGRRAGGGWSVRGHLRLDGQADT